MERVTRGLVIDGQWVSLILAGLKNWEMRSQATSMRGKVGLIRKGTGQVCGVVDIVDSLPPLSQAEMIETIARHQIPENMIRSGEVEKWRFPWVLENPRGFIDPVPYKHPSGAVIWVQLDDKVSDAIAGRLQNAGRKESAETEHRPRTVQKQRPPERQALSDLLTPLPVPDHPRPSHAVPKALPNIIGRTVVTEGNLRHNHIYLRSFIDKFPADAIGGSNRSALAKSSVKVRWAGSEWNETDLDGQKLFFRARGMVKRFLEDSGAVPGDTVEVEQTEPRHYILHLRKSNKHAKSET